jgi:MFS family permease
MTDFEKKLTSNIWKYTIILIANKRVFVAILGAFYLTVPGVMAKQIGLILLIGNLAGFILEIPSGYASDKFGHKRTLVFARVAVLLSSITFLFANNLLLLCVASVLLSLGQAFQSGTGTAFMHETFRDLGREKDYTRVMGKASAIGFAVPAVFMTLVPFLVTWSMKGPFLVAVIIDLIGLWASIALVAPHVKPEHVEEIRKTS